MAKTKSMGIEYQIKVKDKWEHLTGAVNTTKQLIEKTQQHVDDFSERYFPDDNGMEDKILRGYLVPGEEESFADYQQRFIQAYVGTGFKGKMAQFLMGKKIPYSIRLTQNSGESTLTIGLIIREGEYKVTIGASGDYSERGEKISEGIKEYLGSKGIKSEHKTLDKLIKY